MSENRLLPPLELERELARRQQQTQERRFRQFDPLTLAWLILLPEWTTGLAGRLDLPGSPADPRELVDRLEAADLVERREVLGPDAVRQEAFWARSAIRPLLAGHLRTTLGDAALARQADLLWSAVVRAGLDLPALGLAGWAEVVGEHRHDPSGRSLLRAVDERLDAGLLAEATSLVATARAIADVLGGPLRDAARRAQWRIDRAYRTADDAQHLRHYFNRRDVEDALGELLDEQGQPWALHLLGAGGVGKTMVIRYLASGRYAADRGRPRFAVARADFDHLDPRYPEQRPADLLLVLADELTGFGGTRASYGAYRRFRDSADELHEQLARSDRVWSSQHDQAARDELLRAAVARFGSFAAELPRPVVLVLDTCEELAKLYPPGASAPAIDRTFELLELLHAELPAIRIVLAGRRWLVPPPDQYRGAGGPKLRARDYVRVLEIGGFSREEADGYLDARQPAIRPALRSALLDRAREQPAEPDRYNPFELASYCEWAASEPGLDAAELRGAAGDPYVERRIIGRLPDSPVRDSLAIAAELGRFDLDLIAPALRRNGVPPEVAFDELAGQEWTRVLSVGTDGRPRVIAVDEHLRDRLRRVTAAHPDRYPLDRDQLGRDAAAAIDAARLEELPAETIEAAARLLPVGAAGALWQRLEDRIVEEDAWAWAAQVTTRVAAVEDARAADAEPGGPTILAAILATQAAARIHLGSPAALRDLWREVERLSARHPSAGLQTILAARARLGRVATGEQIELTEPEVRAAPAGSAMAAVDGLILRVRLWHTLGGFRDHIDPAVSATALLADAVIALWEARLDDAAAAADLATTVAERAGSAAARWADWLPPPRLIDRCRLVRLLVALDWAEPLTAMPLASWRDDALAYLPDIDSERLVALSLQIELGYRPLDRALLESVERVDSYAPGRRPSTWLHRRVPALVLILAEAWSVLDEPERARNLLVARAARRRWPPATTPTRSKSATWRCSGSAAAS
jgi:hypothetical protein